MSNLIFFTETQGTLLLQLVLAQLLSDFVLQTDDMVKNKRWFSPAMAIHIIIVFGTTALLSGFWKLAAIIAVLHWFIDSIKISLTNRHVIKESKLTTPNVLFMGDQVAHIGSTILLWAICLDLTVPLADAFQLPFSNYTILLIILGYVIAIWPVGYLIKNATQGMTKVSATPTAPTLATSAPQQPEDKIEHGGKRIGQYERAIILTFVLLNQYEAIGFLITGKSIIRFAQRDENLRSEYVLVGTMMSYAFSIITGVLVNWLITLAA